MAIWNRIGCALGLHAPYRRRVAWDGFSYVGECRFCGAAVRRLGRKRWRIDKGRPKAANIVRHFDED